MDVLYCALAKREVKAMIPTNSNTNWTFSLKGPNRAAVTIRRMNSTAVKIAAKVTFDRLILSFIMTLGLV